MERGRVHCKKHDHVSLPVLSPILSILLPFSISGFPQILQFPLPSTLLGVSSAKVMPKAPSRVTSCLLEARPRLHLAA